MFLADVLDIGGRCRSLSDTAFDFHVGASIDDAPWFLTEAMIFKSDRLLRLHQYYIRLFEKRGVLDTVWKQYHSSRCIAQKRNLLQYYFYNFYRYHGYIVLRLRLRHNL